MADNILNTLLPPTRPELDQLNRFRESQGREAPQYKPLQTWYSSLVAS